MDKTAKAAEEVQAVILEELDELSDCVNGMVDALNVQRAYLKREVGGTEARVRTGVEVLSGSAKDMKAEVRHCCAAISRMSEVVAGAAEGERAAREEMAGSMVAGMRRVEETVDLQCRGRLDDVVRLVRRNDGEGVVRGKEGGSWWIRRVGAD